MENRKTVLVIDDDPTILEGMAFVLREEGFRVHTWSVFDMEHMREIKPDLVILDIFLQEQDGRTIAREIRADPQFRSMPIVMISAVPMTRESADKSGASSFIAKPFDLYAMIDTIHGYLRAPGTVSA